MKIYAIEYTDEDGKEFKQFYESKETRDEIYKCKKNLQKEFPEFNTIKLRKIDFEEIRKIDFEEIKNEMYKQKKPSSKK